MYPAADLPRSIEEGAMTPTDLSDYGSQAIVVAIPLATAPDHATAPAPVGVPPPAYTPASQMTRPTPRHEQR